MRSLIFAGAALASSISLSAPAAASDWACKAILCLSNPGGPMQYVECRPPVEKLFESLSFPGCPSAGPYDLTSFSRGTVRRVTRFDNEYIEPDWASAADLGRRYVRYSNEAQGRKLIWLDARRFSQRPQPGNNYGRAR